jgi:ATP-binding protein involved in chromosome partitioning
MNLESKIINALKTVKDPFSQKDLLMAGAVQGLKITEKGGVSFVLEIDTQYLQKGRELKENLESLLKNIDGIMEVNIVLTAQRKPRANNSLQKTIPGITYILAVASGKGGVGKSTTAVNLACALQQMNLKVGMLDADIYGPSFPRLLGINKKPTTDDGKFMNPIEVHGLKSMSMGYMMAEGAPAIWRGPMAQKALQQMLHQTKWGELDVLVVDLPPGTGDIHLSLAQLVLISGAIVVSTPQDLALIDARRGLEMFLKVNIPVLGFVENMSYFLCPHCEGRSDIFETGGVHREAKKLGLSLLAEIPLHMAIREASERGKPIVLHDPMSNESQIYRSLAASVVNNLENKK